MPTLLIPGGGSYLCLGHSCSKHMENAGSRNHSSSPEAEQFQGLSTVQQSSKSSQQVLALLWFAQTFPQCTRMFLPHNRYHQCWANCLHNYAYLHSAVSCSWCHLLIIFLLVFSSMETFFLFLTHSVALINMLCHAGVLLTLALLPRTCCFRWSGKGIWLNSPFPPPGMLLLIIIYVSY